MDHKKIAINIVDNSKDLTLEQQQVALLGAAVHAILHVADVLRGKAVRDVV